MDLHRRSAQRRATTLGTHLWRQETKRRLFSSSYFLVLAFATLIYLSASTPDIWLSLPRNLCHTGYEVFTDFFIYVLQDFLGPRT